MKKFFLPIIASAAGLLSLGLASAHADDRNDRRPDYCDVNHDHRAHASTYYDYYPEDRYSRAGAYRGSGVSLSVRVGDRYDDRRRYRDRGYDRRYDRGYDRGRRNGYRGRGARTVNREVYDTRYRARIVLTEEVVRGRYGPRLVCTVEARGREARHVSERRMYRIAHRECSRQARIRVLA